MNPETAIASHMAACSPELPPHTAEDCHSWHVIELDATSECYSCDCDPCRCVEGATTDADDWWIGGL